MILSVFKKMSATASFDYNGKIESSIFETNSLVNGNDISYADYCAYFGSIECLNKAELKDTARFAIAGGDIEILHLCEEHSSQFDDLSYKIAIEYHQNEIYDYLCLNLTKKPKMEDVIKYCIEYDNYYILSTMTDADLKNIGDLIARNDMCNLFLFDIAKFSPNNNLYLLESIKSSNIEYPNLVKQVNKIKKAPISFTYNNNKTVHTLK